MLNVFSRTLRFVKFLKVFFKLGLLTKFRLKWLHLSTLIRKCTRYQALSRTTKPQHGQVLSKNKRFDQEGKEIYKCSFWKNWKLTTMGLIETRVVRAIRASGNLFETNKVEAEADSVLPLRRFQRRGPWRASCCRPWGRSPAATWPPAEARRPRRRPWPCPGISRRTASPSSWPTSGRWPSAVKVQWYKRRFYRRVAI